MRCQKCGDELPEDELEESHDIPCYLFFGKDRNERKNQADKYGRHWLCIDCHEKYENEILRNWVFYYLLKEMTPEQKEKGKKAAFKVKRRFF